MKYAFLVAWREYTENIKTKGFWIGIFLFPVILMLAIQVPVFLETKGTPVRHFVLIDRSGEFEALIDAQLTRLHRTQTLDALRDYARTYAQAAPAAASDPSATHRTATNDPSASFKSRALQIIAKQPDAPIDSLLEQIKPHLKPNPPPFEPPRPRFRRVPFPDSPDRPLSEMSEQLKPYLTRTRSLSVGNQPVNVYAAVLIPSNITQLAATRAPRDLAQETDQNIEYWSANLADQSLRELLQKSIDDEIRRRAYIEGGINRQLVQEIERIRVPIDTLNPKKEQGTERVGQIDIMRQWAPTGFVYILWIGIFAIAQMLLNNTIEEKSNRIIEVLLSSVTPAELMMGKLAGIAAVGLTMISAWMGALVSILVWKSEGQAALAGQLLSILQTSHLIPAFILYFILGYLTYAGIILAIGSVCNTLKEAQNYMGVITMILMVPLLTMAFIPKDPNGTVARVLSWIPLYTPFIMLNRAMADPPLIDLVGTIVLLFAFTGFVLWMSVNVFRTGILRTGQPPKLLELIRWIRTR